MTLFGASSHAPITGFPYAPHHRPYLTTTPWQPFTAGERKRPAPLARCPSARCRRAKACIDAHEGIYCQRSHESVAEAQARKGLGKPSAPKGKSRGYTWAEIRAKVVESDMALAAAVAKTEEMRDRWKAGEFDHLYGTYKARGVLKHPPIRQYTE